MSYQPRTGTPAALLVEFLTSSPRPASTTDLAAVIGCKPGSLAAILGTALKHGLVHRPDKGQYAAGPGAKRARRKATAVAVINPEPGEAGVVATDPSPFTCGFFTDGELVLCYPSNIGENNVTLSRPQVQTLFEFLTKLGGLATA